MHHEDTTTTNTLNPTLNGKWILLRTKGHPSLRPYLETMGVSALAIEANEKGDAEHDTIHDITLTRTRYRIQKLSRVNHLILDVALGEEQLTPKTVMVSPPNEDVDDYDEEQQQQQQKKKEKDPSTRHPLKTIQGVQKIRVMSDHLAHVRIESELPTMNGVAKVVDVKTIVPWNEMNHEDNHDTNNHDTNSNDTNNINPTTERHPFLYVQNLTIYNQTTQQSHHTIRYFVPFEGDMEPTASTAGGNKKQRLDHMG